MSIAILIATFFSIGFFVESTVGFGGGLISYSLLGFFVDIKQMVIAGLYIGTCSSAYIVYTDFKSFNKKLFLQSVPFCLIGTVTGVYIFSKTDSNQLALILGLLLIFLSVKMVFFDKIILPKIFKNKLLIIGGMSQGIFGIGGPFIISALQKDFKNKSQLRTTMGMFFLSFNLVRITQLTAQGQINFDFFTHIWWAMIPVGIAVYLGFKTHAKIKEQTAKRIIAVITLLGGIKFLIQFFK